MLTADYIASLPDELVGLYSEVETEILESVVARLQKTKALTPSSVYQIEKLRDLGRLNSDVTKILAKALGVSQKQVKKLMQEAGIEALSVDDAVYRAAGKTPLAVAQSAALREVLAAGIKKTNGLFKNFTGTTATTARMAYSNVLDKAYLEVTSGAYSYQESIRRAVKTLSKQGITKVAYPTGGQDTIETSVRKCVVTGVNQTVGGLQLARAKEMDSDLVEVSAHAGARPSHAVWQGGIYSISGKNPHYGSLYAITGYGTIEGLCGINCYHSFYPYFEGLSSPSFERDPARRLGKTNDQVYEENQNQRVYERRVRESRRECATLDEAMLNAESEDDKAFYKREFDKASVLLKKRESSLRSYCDSIGRRVETDRLTVGGFGRSVSSKAVWANRNVQQVAKAREMAYNQKRAEVRGLIQSDSTNKAINIGNQNKHVLGHKNHTPDRSFIFGTAEDAQKLVDRYAGTGEIKLTSQGEWSKKEFVVADHDVGYVVNPETGTQTTTNRFAIHYGKKGTHIVPAKRNDGK